MFREHGAQFAFVLPLAAADQTIDVGAIIAIGIAEHAQGCRVHVAALFHLIGQRMLAHEIHIQRFIRLGCHKCCLRQQLGLQGQQIPEDARQGHNNINPGTPKLFQRDQRGPNQTPETVKAGFSPKQCQGLTNRPAFAFQIVGAPQNHGDRFREAIAVSHMAFDQACCLPRPIFNRKGTGQAEGVEAMKIPPGWYDFRRAQDIAPRNRPHIAAVQGMDQGTQFMIFCQQSI